MFDLINGLPVVALVARAAWRERYGVLVVGIAAAATALLPVATSSGESLEERVGDPGAHAGLGEALIWFAIPLVLLAAVLVWLDRRDRAQERSPRSRSGTPVKVVAEALKMAGHDPVLAHDGGEALRRFADDDSLEVLLLDIGLPDSDGRDVCLALRSAGQTAPVLFLTALGAVQERLAGFSAGADDYLVKPFDVRELLARIEALRRRRTAGSEPNTERLVLDPS